MIIERIISIYTDKNADEAIRGACTETANQLNKELYREQIASSHSITWLPDRQMYMAVVIVTIRK